MDLSNAWKALGEDPDEIFDEIRNAGTVKDRIQKAKDLLKNAEKLAKALMAVHHPDKNPGNNKSKYKFSRVQNAIESIRYNTEQLEEINRISPQSSDSDEQKSVIIFD